MSDIVITSFGYGHSAAPAGQHLIVDLRNLLYNPHHDPAMRELTGMDQVVYDHVVATEGAAEMAVGLMGWALAARRGLRTADDELHVAIGCVGGRHRSVALARLLARFLGTHTKIENFQVTVMHRDVRKPVIQK